MNSTFRSSSGFGSMQRRSSEPPEYKPRWSQILLRRSAAPERAEFPTFTGRAQIDLAFFSFRVGRAEFTLRILFGSPLSLSEVASVSYYFIHISSRFYSFLLVSEFLFLVKILVDFINKETFTLKEFFILNTVIRCQQRIYYINLY